MDKKLRAKTKRREKPKQPEGNPVATAVAATTARGVRHG